MSATAPRLGPTSCREEESSDYEDDGIIVLKNASRTDSDENERQVVDFNIGRNLEETSSSGEGSTSSVEVQGLMREISKNEWTSKEISTTLREMQDRHRALKSELELTDVKLELKKIQTAAGQVLSLTDKVSNMENVLANSQQEKLDCTSKIAELRREVMELKKAQSRSQCSSNSWTNNDFGERPIRPKTSNCKTPTGCSTGRLCLMSTASCPTLNPSQRVFYQERDTAILQHKKISFLEAQNKGSESEVQQLEHHVVQLSKTLEILLTGFGQKVPNDKAHYEVLMKNLPTNVRLKTQVECEEKYQEATGQDSSAYARFTVPATSKKRSYNFETFSQFERANIKTGPVSFIL